MPRTLGRGLKQGTVAFDKLKAAPEPIRVREYYNLVAQECGRHVGIVGMVGGLPGWSKDEWWKRAAEAARAGRDPVAALRRMGL